MFNEFRLRGGEGPRPQNRTAPFVCTLERRINCDVTLVGSVSYSLPDLPGTMSPAPADGAFDVTPDFDLVDSPPPALSAQFEAIKPAYRISLPSDARVILSSGQSVVAHTWPDLDRKMREKGCTANDLDYVKNVLWPAFERQQIAAAERSMATLRQRQATVKSFLDSARWHQNQALTNEAEGERREAVIRHRNMLDLDTPAPRADRLDERARAFANRVDNLRQAEGRIVTRINTRNATLDSLPVDARIRRYRELIIRRVLEVDRLHAQVRQVMANTERARLAYQADQDRVMMAAPPAGAVVFQYDPGERVDSHGPGHVGVVVKIDGRSFVAENLPARGQVLTPWTVFVSRTFDGGTSVGRRGELHHALPAGMTPERVQRLTEWVRANTHSDGRLFEWNPFNKCTEFVDRAFREGAGIALPITVTPITTPNQMAVAILGRSFRAVSPQEWAGTSNAVMSGVQTYLIDPVAGVLNAIARYGNAWIGF